MKTYVGFVFTEFFYEYLKKSGFIVNKDTSTLNQGYNKFSIIFSNNSQIEIREIVDETLYLKSHKIEHFEPFIIDDDKTHSSYQAHSNGITEIVEPMHIEQITNGKLLFYFKLHKEFSLCAIKLKCIDKNTFFSHAQPDKTFDIDGQKLYLIQMGTRCFDLCCVI